MSEHSNEPEQTPSASNFLPQISLSTIRECASKIGDKSMAEAEGFASWEEVISREQPALAKTLMQVTDAAIHDATERQTARSYALITYLSLRREAATATRPTFAGPEGGQQSLPPLDDIATGAMATTMHSERKGDALREALDRFATQQPYLYQALNQLIKPTDENMRSYVNLITPSALVVEAFERWYSGKQMNEALGI